MSKSTELMLKKCVDAYQSEPSRVLSTEEKDLVARAMKAMVATPPRSDEKKRSEAFSPFVYPH